MASSRGSRRATAPALRRASARSCRPLRSGAARTSCGSFSSPAASRGGSVRSRPERHRGDERRSAGSLVKALQALDADRTDRPRQRRALLLAWVHLAVLWAFAFAKPLFDVVADSPEFFVARGNTRGDILIFAIATVLVPPTLLVLVEALLVRLPR